jgi:NAD(P)-dependent dehydrogenase (short-subunit alcohol dehydrogenase family)
MSVRPLALILGVSSGFGAASARAWAAAGWDVSGLHLDRRAALSQVEALRAELGATGASVQLWNRNACDDAVRAEVIAELKEGGQPVRALLHSLAFGSLTPLVLPQGGGARRSQLDMTLDVMAHSLVYWVQDLLGAGLLGPGARIFALSSAGSHHASAGYGPLSAAKAALEAHVRQLCRELAPLEITVNALMPGVTETPASARIPGIERLKEQALARNPRGRLTRPEDVAAALVALCAPGLAWMSGNVIRLDGGEDVCA